MAREKKDGIARTFYLMKDIDKQLDKHSKDTGLPKTVIVEKALDQYFKKITDLR